MRPTLWIFGVLCLALLAYLLWPVMGFYRLDSVIGAKDSAALAEVVDIPAVRQSLIKELVHTYLKMMGKKREKAKQPKLTMIEQTVAVRVGTSIAEPIVAQLVNEKTLLDLLSKGHFKLKGASGAGKDRVSELSALAPFTGGNAPNPWQVWSMEYRGNDVYMYLPPGKPREEQFRVKLNLSGLQWKLSGLDLPKPMLMQLVKEIVGQQRGMTDE